MEKYFKNIRMHAVLLFSLRLLGIYPRSTACPYCGATGWIHEIGDHGMMWFDICQRCKQKGEV